MSAMPRIAVDPFLICLPAPGGSAADFERFVLGLMDWADALRRRDVCVCVAENCLSALLENGLYPYSRKMPAMLKEYGLDHIGPDSVCRVAQTILELTPYLEHHLGIKEIYHDDSVTTCDPAYFITRLHPNCARAFQTCLVTMAAWRSVSGPDHDGFVLASIPSPHRETDSQLSIEGAVDGITDLNDTLTEWRPPRKVNESLEVLYGFKSLLKNQGCLALWAGATSSDGARDAIRTRIDEHRETGVSCAKLKRFLLGPRFLESAKHWGFGARTDLAFNLIDSCARILLNIPKNEVKPFRVSEDSNEQRVRQDKARAWRTHLTKKGAGFRLMYWERADGVIEFANVGDKDELVIF